MNKKLTLILIIPLLLLSPTVFNMKVTAQPTVKIGVLFPKYLPEGGGGFGGSGHGGMYDGAQMAANEINTAGGINVGGTMENIVLDFQDEGALDPILVPPGYNTAITTASMTEMLTGACQFIVGGSRTETTTAALSLLQTWNTDPTFAPVPFFICGAATSALINTNETANPGGQWVFRVAPVNDTQLFYTVANYLKQYLARKLARIFTNATYPPETPGQFRYAVIAEDLTWTQTMAYLLTAPAGYPSTPGYNYFLGPNVTTNGVIGTGGSPIPGRNLVPANGYDFTSLVSALKAQNVHLIIDLFTMPEVNNLITAVKAANMPAMLVGIDIPGQQQSHWSDTSGDCEYEVDICYSGTGTPIVPGYTDVFFGNFCSFSGGYWPMYTASGAYDAIYQIRREIESAGSTDPNVLLPVIQSYQNVGLTGEFKYTTAPVSGNDVYADSNGVNWTQYDAMPCGWARSEMTQWIQNATVPAFPYPNVGAQMNVVDPINQLYSRKTQIPPYVYPLAIPDINLDGIVNMIDLNIVAQAYGTEPGYPKWNIEADVNLDGRVDIKDMNIVAHAINEADVAVTNLTSAKTVICQGHGGNLTITAQNLGHSGEIFNVTVYANTTIINTLNVNLASGDNATLEFVWNTTGFDYGNYTLNAAADVVPGDIDTLNNNCTGGCVIISIVGDITGPDDWPDGKVDMYDIGNVARRFMEKPPNPNYNPNYDIDDNGVINMVDIATVAKHFMEHYP